MMDTSSSLTCKLQLLFLLVLFPLRREVTVHFSLSFFSLLQFTEYTLPIRVKYSECEGERKLNEEEALK